MRLFRQIDNLETSMPQPGSGMAIHTGRIRAPRRQTVEHRFQIANRYVATIKYYDTAYATHNSSFC